MASPWAVEQVRAIGRAARGDELAGQAAGGVVGLGLALAGQAEPQLGLGRIELGEQLLRPRQLGGGEVAVLARGFVADRECRALQLLKPRTEGIDRW